MVSSLFQALGMHSNRLRATYLMDTWTEHGNEKAVINVLQEVMTNRRMSDLSQS